MAVDKAMIPSDIQMMDDETPDLELDIEAVTEDAIEIQMDDGSIEVDFGDASLDIDLGAGSHDENIAEIIDEGDLEELASDLVGAFIADRGSRKEWAMSYIKGLDLLGMKIEERSTPWQGASGVYHPMMTEAVVRFQAQAMGELMPAAGPARSKILGKITREKFEQSQRVESELNYLITEEMPDYRDEMEQMLFKLPLAGSAFKKIYYDPLLERPVSLFVPAEDFVVSYGASNLRTCPRFTHVMKDSSKKLKPYRSMASTVTSNCRNQSAISPILKKNTPKWRAVSPYMTTIHVILYWKCT
jgi:hypothetical protein